MSTTGSSLSRENPPLLELAGVSKFFDRTVALREVSLRIEAGQRWALFGRNGAGKTTLLRILATLMKPSRGQVRFQGEALVGQEQNIRSQVGFLSHATALYGDLTAEENLSFYARLHGIETPAERVQDILKQVGLDQRAREPVRGFSRGMQQRLGIARAFLHHPKILIFDEPYTGLDAPSADLLQTLLARAEGITLILTSHDLERGLALAGHAAILDKGQLVAQQEVAPDKEDTVREAYARWVQGKAKR